MCMCLCVAATDLDSDGVLVLPLHVVDVPGHPRHGVDGLLEHLVALLLGVKVLGDLLRDTQRQGLSKTPFVLAD